MYYVLSFCSLYAHIAAAMAKKVYIQGGPKSRPKLLIIIANQLS